MLACASPGVEMLWEALLGSLGSLLTVRSGVRTHNELGFQEGLGANAGRMGAWGLGVPIGRGLGSGSARLRSPSLPDSAGCQAASSASV